MSIRSKLVKVFLVVLMGAFCCTASAEPSESNGNNLDAQAASSANNLKQWGIVFKMYANESKGCLFPPYGAPGRLMCDHKEVFPEYLCDLNICISPLNPVAETYQTMDGVEPADVVNDSSYVYLSHALTSARDVDTFVAACKKWAKGQGSMEEDLDSGADQKIYRIREGVERFLITDISDPTAAVLMVQTIPVMLERREFYPDGTANVLFLDGHVARIAPGHDSLIDKIYAAIEELRPTRTEHKSDLAEKK